MVEILTFSTIVEAPYERVSTYLEKKESLGRSFPFLEKVSYQTVLKKHSETQTEIIDQVEPVKKKQCLDHAFTYRHRMLQEDFRQFKRSHRKPLKILLSGSSGFIGKHLLMLLRLFGDDVYTLVRRCSGDPKEIFWDPFATSINKNQLEGFDVVIHLAGKNIGSRWTRKGKKEIYESRVVATRFLTCSLNLLEKPPKVFLCASACGFYGDRREEELDETSFKGKGFLSDVVDTWESSARGFTRGRVVMMRFGVVIGLQGGMLQKVLPLFKRGLGATMGSGFEWMSWISIDDLSYQILHVICQESLQGPLNFTTPYPVTSKEFSHTLAALLKKRVFFKLTKALIKMFFREKGAELFLASAKAAPKKLMQSGYIFSYITLFETLKVYLKSLE